MSETGGIQDRGRGKEKEEKGKRGGAQCRGEQGVVVSGGRKRPRRQSP